MRVFLTSILCSLLAILTTSCQSNSYKLSGTVEGLSDGDTLLLTDNMIDGTPSDTIIMKDNTFTFEGTIAEGKEAALCMIYSAKNNEINAAFIREPGEITIKLSATPGASRVGGTPCNNEWQRLNDSVMVIGKEINRIAEHIYGNNVTQEEQQQLTNERIKKAVEQFNKNANSEAVFGIHDKTNRVTIKIVDKKSKEVIKELPPEKTLDMIAKVWEMAGILVDEKR